MRRVISDSRIEVLILNWVHRHCKKLTTFWFALIFILCATPGEYIPSADWMDLLSIDKLFHAFLFFVLVSLSFVLAIKNKYRPISFYIILAVSLLYGLMLEIMQAELFRNRSADWKDVIANSLGCFMALLLLRRLKKLFLKAEIISARKLGSVF